MAKFVYRKNGLIRSSFAFPPHDCADDDGLLAAGGDLRLETLLKAYSNGIFPWPIDEDEPIWWFSPLERFVLVPTTFHLPKSLARTMKKGLFEIRVNTAFSEVIRACAAVARPQQDGTWIMPWLIEAYDRLHHAGHAHSIEAWRDGQLVGGFYGVRVGRVFCGESMFTRQSDASKVAFAHFCLAAKDAGIDLIDCQMPTEHLARFGATTISRQAYLEQLAKLSVLDANIDFWNGQWTETIGKLSL